MLLMCSICTELINEDDHIDVTSCGHIYHHQCVEPWVRSSQNCPQCRESLTEASLVRVFPTSGSSEAAASATRGSSPGITEETAPQETVESLNQLLSSVREDLSARNNDVVLLQAQLQSMEETHERETMTLVEALRRNAKTSKNKLKSAEQNVTALLQQFRSSSAELNELRSENLDLRNRVQEVESDLRSNKTELADSQRTVLDLEQHLDGAKKKANILKETNQSLAQRILILASEKHEQSENRLKVVALEKELSSRNSCIAELKAQLAAEEGRAGDLARRVGDLARGITWDWYNTDRSFYKSQLYFGESANQTPEDPPSIPKAVAAVLKDFVDVPSTSEAVPPDPFSVPITEEEVLTTTETELITEGAISATLETELIALEVVSTAPETVPNVPKAVASTFDAEPNVPEAVPTAPEAVPTAPESVPNAPEVVPTAPKTVQTAPETVPTAPEVVPTAPKTAPTAPDTVPTASKAVPTAPKAVLADSKIVPTLPKAVPTTPVPTPRIRSVHNQTVLAPNILETVSTTLEAMPTVPGAVTVTAVPITTKTVDSPEIEPVILRSEVVPSVEAVPNSSASVPNSSASVPNSPASVPKSPVPTPRPRSTRPCL